MMWPQSSPTKLSPSQIWSGREESLGEWRARALLEPEGIRKATATERQRNKAKWGQCRMSARYAPKGGKACSCAAVAGGGRRTIAQDEGGRGGFRRASCERDKCDKKASELVLCDRRQS